MAGCWGGRPNKIMRSREKRQRERDPEIRRWKWRRGDPQTERRRGGEPAQRRAVRLLGPCAQGSWLGTFSKSWCPRAPGRVPGSQALGPRVSTLQGGVMTASAHPSSCHVVRPGWSSALGELRGQRGPHGLPGPWAASGQSLPISRENCSKAMRTS